MSEIINVTDKEQLKYLYDNWAMTWEGLSPDSFEEALEYCGGENAKGYNILGKDFNELCNLTGDNAYPDDLNIFAIYPFKGLAMQFGARWMTDIIDNNAEREGYHPFKDLDESLEEDFSKEDFEKAQFKAFEMLLDNPNTFAVIYAVHPGTKKGKKVLEKPVECLSQEAVQDYANTFKKSLKQGEQVALDVFYQSQLEKLKNHFKEKGLYKEVELETESVEKPLTEELKIFTDSLDGFIPSEKAKDFWQEIVDAGKVETLQFALEALYPDGIQDIALDDLLKYESDWIRDLISLDEEDIEEVETFDEDDISLDDLDLEDEEEIEEPVFEEEELKADIDEEPELELNTDELITIEPEKEEESEEIKVEESLTEEKHDSFLGFVKLPGTDTLLKVYETDDGWFNVMKADKSKILSKFSSLDTLVTFMGPISYAEESDDNFLAEDIKKEETTNDTAEVNDTQMESLAESFVKNNFKENTLDENTQVSNTTIEAIKEADDSEEVVAVDDTAVEAMMGLPSNN